MYTLGVALVGGSVVALAWLDDRDVLSVNWRLVKVVLLTGGIGGAWYLLDSLGRMFYLL